MTAYRGQWRENGHQVRPHISIVCNFSRPVGETPSLLTFNEVTTLFHEFGPAFHDILADTVYESLSGTNVYWHFVDLPRSEEPTSELHSPMRISQAAFGLQKTHREVLQHLST